MPNSNDEFLWTELAALKTAGQMVRRHFARVNDAQVLIAWRQAHGNRDIYSTVCHFSEPSWQGRYTCPLFFDIDSSDLEQARCQTLRLCDLLWNHIKIPPAMMSLWFSGSKGYHVEVPTEVFGVADDQCAMDLWRCLARRLQTDITCLDTSIYQRNRLWRLPNSINNKSGLHKVAIDHKELQDFGTQYVVELARQPRADERMGVAQEVAEAMGWFRRALVWRNRQAATQRRVKPSASRGRGWRVPPCIQYIEAAGTLPDGIRHQTYFVLARYWASIGMAPTEALERLQLIDERHPIRDPDYLARVVTNAKKYPGFTSCPNEVLYPYCSPSACFLRKTSGGQGSPGAICQAENPRHISKEISNARITKLPDDKSP